MQRTPPLPALWKDKAGLQCANPCLHYCFQRNDISPNIPSPRCQIHALSTKAAMCNKYHNITHSLDQYSRSVVPKRNTFANGSRRDLSDAALFETCTLLALEYSSIGNRSRGCVVVCHTPYPVSPWLNNQHTFHASSFSYLSSREST